MAQKWHISPLISNFAPRKIIHMEPFFDLRNNHMILNYSNKGKKFRVSTGIKITQELFNGKRIIGGNHNQENLTLDDQMTKLKKIIFDYKLRFNENPSVEYVKKEWEKPIEELRKDLKILEGFKIFNKIKNGDEKAGIEGDVKDGRLFEVLYNDLEEFITSKGIDYKLSDVNNQFRKSLEQFYLKRKVKRFGDETTGLNNSTIRKRISTFKTFMNYMVEEGYTDNKQYETWSFKKHLTTIKKGNILTLTLQEFETLKKHDFSNNKKLEYVRDLYLLSCSTGLRFSDVIRLDKNCVKVHEGEEVIEINIQKLDEELLRIPLNPLSKSILIDKFKYEVKSISNQKVNDYLYEVFNEVGIKTPVKSLKRVGNKVVEKIYPKSKLLTFHSSRKFFITNLIIKGISIDNIMKWTGHSGDFGVFYRYINQGLEEKDAMKKAFS